LPKKLLLDSFINGTQMKLLNKRSRNYLYLHFGCHASFG
jgi:hypothetical protein